jgi:hypothetical protein
MTVKNRVTLFLPLRFIYENGPVAQRLEQGTHNPLVPGSNPGGPSFGLEHSEKPKNYHATPVGWGHMSCQKRIIKYYESVVLDHSLVRHFPWHG